MHRHHKRAAHPDELHLPQYAQSVHNIKSVEGADILWVEEAQNVCTAAVMIQEPQRKKEQEKRRSVAKLSPWS